MPVNFAALLSNSSSMFRVVLLKALLRRYAILYVLTCIIYMNLSRRKGENRMKPPQSIENDTFRDHQPRAQTH
jgi:hypothetical protein